MNRDLQMWRIGGWREEKIVHMSCLFFSIVTFGVFDAVLIGARSWVQKARGVQQNTLLKDFETNTVYLSITSHFCCFIVLFLVEYDYYYGEVIWVLHAIHSLIFDWCCLISLFRHTNEVIKKMNSSMKIQVNKQTRRKYSLFCVTATQPYISM